MDKWNALFKYLWEENNGLKSLIKEDLENGNCNQFTDMMITHSFALEQVMSKMEELEKEGEADEENPTSDQ